MKNSFKYYQLKAFYTIKGFFKLMCFKKGATYSGGPNKCISIYRGHRKFYEQQMCNSMYCSFYSTKNKTYPYWQLGMFNWKTITAKIEEK